MMNHSNENARLLSIAPTTYGFGFVIMERGGLVDWGIKTVAGDKNLKSLGKVRELVDRYAPEIVVLQDSDKDSRRSRRINMLHNDLIALAAKLNLSVVLLSSGDLRKGLFPEEKGTKHRMAEILASRFPEELAARLPPKRRPWMSEDFRMGIFEAVALALIAIVSVDGHMQSAKVKRSAAVLKGKNHAFRRGCGAQCLGRLTDSR